MIDFTPTPPAREAVDSRTEHAPPSVSACFKKKAAVQKETTPA
jgi:hypothetical protein